MQDYISDLEEINKFKANFSLILIIIVIIGEIIYGIINGFLTSYGLKNSFLFLLVTFPGVIFGSLIIPYLFFQPSIIAYEKNLTNKKEIFTLNKIFFWTIIIPVLLYLFVIFKKKRNTIIND